MNTSVASYSGTWLTSSGLSRCNSIESIYSIQGKETDVVQDTPDTESYSEDELEYEPVTESENELESMPVLDSSDQTDEEIIKTRVIEVSVYDEWDRGLADTEETSDARDSELEPHDYWRCAQCGSPNNNPLYRLCEKCFQVRKNFFPPRPKYKKKRKHSPECVPRNLSQDSGVESPACPSSQDLTQPSTSSQPHESESAQQSLKSTSPQPDTDHALTKIIQDTTYPLRRAGSADRKNKRMRIDYSDSETDSDSNTTKRRRVGQISPLTKTVSAPTLTIESIDSVNRKATTNSCKEKEIENGDSMCMVCVSEPKSGVFVHGRIAHICCCYKCAMKVWAKTKRCPVCNCRVSNVLKAVVM